MSAAVFATRVLAHGCVHRRLFSLQTKGEMSLEQGLKLAFDFDIIPDVCNNRQFRELWKIVNRSEAYVAMLCQLSEFPLH